MRASSALLTLVLILPAGARAADDATSLPEVVVTAPAMEQPMVIETGTDNPRTPIPPADGAGYLKNIPGFSVARQGAIDGDPVLRGIGGSRLNILLDDAPVLGGCPNRMDPPTAYIFPGSFDKLTVLKGPQSVVHGGSAMGTILVERTPPKFDKTEIRGDANALYGSNDRNDEVIDAQAGAKEGFLRAIATHSSSDDYKDGNGNALHSRYWRHSGTAMVGWTPDADTLLQFSFDKSQAQAAMPGKMMDGTQFDREGVNLEFTKTNISPLLAKLKFLAHHNYVDHVMDTYSMRYTTTMMTAASQVDHLMQGGKALVELTPDPGQPGGGLQSRRTYVAVAIGRRIPQWCRPGQQDAGQGHRFRHLFRLRRGQPRIVGGGSGHRRLSPDPCRGHPPQRAAQSDRRPHLAFRFPPL